MSKGTEVRKDPGAASAAVALFEMRTKVDHLGAELSVMRKRIDAMSERLDRDDRALREWRIWMRWTGALSLVAVAAIVVLKLSGAV